MFWMLCNESCNPNIGVQIIFHLSGFRNLSIRSFLTSSKILSRLTFESVADALLFSLMYFTNEKPFSSTKTGLVVTTGVAMNPSSAVKLWVK